MHGKKRMAAFDAFAHCHSRYDYTFPTTMKLPNEECTLTFLRNFLCADKVHENKDPEEFLLKPGPDFDEDEWQEWFQAREEDNVKKRAHGPVPKPQMISRKHKEVSEPGTAENSLQDGSAKVIGYPAKTTSRAFSEVRMNATRTNLIIISKCLYSSLISLLVRLKMHEMHQTHNSPMHETHENA
ncbi:hypothetical protein EDD18DRAFT_1115133 [Armillaria luteobubalina]|uniref:Uncharacterized protein n=1 Tax=Armillaria luteobubalina TaxID=153913 RepID=A0AA39P3K3_9AGAR|nr:hypothetical protein EDD18DRAFT_1115133 [Armillaria luteobubalina]